MTPGDRRLPVVILSPRSGQILGDGAERWRRTIASLAHIRDLQYRDLDPAIVSADLAQHLNRLHEFAAAG